MNADLIKTIFESMSEDAERSKIEPIAFRSRFYEATSKPMLVEASNIDMNVFLRQTIVDCIDIGFGIGTSFELVSWEHNVEQRLFNVEVKFNIVYSTDMAGIVVTRPVYKSKRPEKLANVIRNIVDLIMDRVVERVREIMLDQSYNAFDIFEMSLDSIQRDRDAIIKQASTLYSGMMSPVYAYFVDRDYYQHYRLLSQKESISSCMSYGLEKFDNHYRPLDSEDSTWVHPLHGYHYAPDFRLCLFSRLSPDEMRELITADEADYPFISRAVVFANEYEASAFSYAKIYGSEAVKAVVNNSTQFNLSNYPQGSELFVVLFNDIDHCNYRYTDEIQEYLEEKQNGHKFLMTAPYVDTYCCSFLLPETTPIKRKDGLLVLPIRVSLHSEYHEDKLGKRLDTFDTNRHCTVEVANGIAFACKSNEEIDRCYVYIYDDEKCKYYQAEVRDPDDYDD